MNDTEAIKALYRSNFSFFIRKCFQTVDPTTEYLHNWHIDALAEYLEACRRKEIKRLIINMPPRSLKSITVSVAFPAFILGHDPAARIMCASYSRDLSTKHSIDTRLIMSNNWYRVIFPNTVLTKDQNVKTKFMTTQQGFRLATSVGGTATGEGCNFSITDDAHNQLQAASETRRKTALDWFDQTWSTRLNNKKEDVMIVVMQRLHELDLTGHLLNQGIWEHLCLPAIAEKKQTISYGNFSKTREEGEYLHEARMGKKELEIEKIRLGSYGFAGQMQQNPSPEGGGIVKLAWFVEFGVLPSDYINCVFSWDTAQKENAGSDYSVCTVWLRTKKGHYLIDILREKMEYPRLRKAFESMYEKYKPDCILIEDKSSGQSLIQDFKFNNKYSIIPINPDKDKVTRMSAVSPIIEAGNVYIPNKSSWLMDFENEIIKFPNGAHDDICDSVSQYLDYIRKLEQRSKPNIITL